MADSDSTFYQITLQPGFGPHLRGRILLMFAADIVGYFLSVLMGFKGYANLRIFT